jgi:fructokinase
MNKTTTQQRPRLLVAGFVALDVIFGLDDPAPRFYAGGTSGNVSAGLAFLGWDVLAVGRLSQDVAGEMVRRDLERWGVNTSFLGLAPAASTPIVLERIELSRNGVPKHRFLWNCPNCGSYFPAFRAILRTQVDFIKGQTELPQVFFVDRVSRSTIELARHLQKAGSVIYFEPSAACDARLFREMLQLCDVLKYSAQRARSFAELLRHHKAQLEIETLGEDGLRFRTRRAFSTWHSLAAYEVKIKDTAGSGDWTTVGLISTLFGNGKPPLPAASRQNIVASLKHGQAVAALNCRFEGARGAMYHLTRPRFVEAVAAIESEDPGVHKERKISFAQQVSTFAVCPNCGPRPLTRPGQEGTATLQAWGSVPLRSGRPNQSRLVEARP